MVRKVIVIIVGLLLAALFFYAAGIIGKAPEEKKEVQKKTPARTVPILIAKNKAIQTQVPIFGKLQAYRKVELFSEVSGMLDETSKPFKEGVNFAEGSLLLQLDDQEARLNLQAQRAALLTSITQMMPDLKTDYTDNFEAWNNYRKNFDVTEKTPDLPKPKSDREKSLVTMRNIYNQYYTIRSLEERLSKYRIYAPFSGEITMSAIDKGSFVRTGQKIGELMNTANYELAAAVPLKDLDFIKVGDKVKLRSEDISGEWTGTIRRMSNSVESNTQTVKLFVEVRGAQLRENMYLSGYINANTISEVVEIPRKLVERRENGEAVYVLRDSSLQLQAVQTVRRSEKMALVRGIPDGTKLLGEPLTGIFEGMKAVAE